MSDDDGYKELARALDEDGDPGVDLLTGFYPSVAELVAERDQLRAVVEAALRFWYSTYPTVNAMERLPDARKTFETTVVDVLGLDLSEEQRRRDEEEGT